MYTWCGTHTKLKQIRNKKKNDEKTSDKIKRRKKNVQQR